MDFWDFSGWPLIPQNIGHQEPKIITPHLIKHLNPYVKFILIFRQPSERYICIHIYGFDGSIVRHFCIALKNKMKIK